MVDVKKQVTKEVKPIKKENTTETKPVKKEVVKRDKSLVQRIEQSFKLKNPNDEKNTKESLIWFRNYISKNIKNVRLPQILEDKTFKRKDNIVPGAMCLFQYDPLLKVVLPFYDTMPLIFPVKRWKSSDGKSILTGINVHYLQPVLRQKIFLAILEMQRTKNLNWNILKKLAEHKLFEHSVKNYRLDHLTSKFIIVPEEVMEIVLFLPLARFKKGTSKDAWRL